MSVDDPGAPDTDGCPDPESPEHDPVLRVLREGEVTVEGRMPWSSNITLLSDVEHDGATVRAIYKPVRGERPLWDFPDGLARREVAAYELSEALGWDLVPHTVLRDGPHGIGSFQRFVEADFEEHYFTLFEADRHLDDLRLMCAFDIVANNTDRKSGHCLVSVADEVFGIDHGLCFHEEFKLRTVIWEFGGEPLPQRILDDLCAFRDAGIPAPLAELLDEREQEALLGRVISLIHAGVFPVDHTGRRYPWPLV